MTRDEYLKEIDNVSSFDKEAVLKIVQISKLYIKSLEEQIQGLQSLLDLKQQEISVLESNIDSAIAELEDCGWYEATDKQQTMEVLYNLKEKQN